MLETFIPLTLSALAVGSVAVPVVRKLAFSEPKTDWLQDELEFDEIQADDATVVCKDGMRFRVFAITGVPYDAKEEDDQEALCVARAHVWQQLHKQDVSLRFFALKRKKDFTIDASWPTPVLNRIGEAVASRFKSAYDVTYFLMVASRSSNRLENAEKVIATNLKKYGVRRIERNPHGLCELTSFLNFLITGDYTVNLRSISQNISANIPAADIASKRFTGEIITETPARHIYRVITVYEWPANKRGRTIPNILRIPADIEINHICEPWNGLISLGRYRREKSLPVIGSEPDELDIEAVEEGIKSEQLFYYRTQMQIIVRSKTPEDMDKIIEQIGDTLSDDQILYTIETDGALAAWFARHPDRGRKLIAPLRNTNHELAALWSFSYSPTGLMGNPFGQKPVRIVAQDSGQSYSVQLHNSDRPQSLGHFLIFAPSNSGKTTLNTFLQSGFAKFPNVQTYMFDSNKGMEFTVNAFGGRYLSLENLEFNPFDREDTIENRQDAKLLLRVMAEEALADPETRTEVLEEISEAVDNIFDYANEPRGTLSENYEDCFNPDLPLRRALSPWVEDAKGKRGQYAHIFNSREDSLSGLLTDTFMTVINMNDVLKDSVLGPAVVTHISTAIKRASKDRAGGIITIEEAGNLLQNSTFREWAAEAYREYRRENLSVGMIFQETKALLNTDIAEAVIDNTATFIFFPNTQAKADAYYPFNLNEEHINFIRNPLSQGSRKVLIVQRDPATGWEESAIVDVDLTPYGPDITRYFKSGPKANELMRELQQAYGEAWVEHVPC